MLSLRNIREEIQNWTDRNSIKLSIETEDELVVKIYKLLHDTKNEYEELLKAKKGNN